MKKLLFLLLLVVAKVGMAQPPKYDDLLMYYTDENWEKLIKSAEKYTLSDKTKSDPLAHLWLAKGLYKMSLSGTDDETYKNAYKDAIGAMGKFIKLDKSGDIAREEEKFVNEFKMSVVENIGNDMGNPKKAAGWVTKYYKLDMNSIGAKYLEGACKFLDSDKTSANTLWKDADAKLKAIESTGIDSWMEADKELLKIGVMKTAECYISMKQVEKAKTLLGKVAQWYEDDEAFKEFYDEVVN